ncbi:MAG: M23 family metallopeptidase [Leptospiraceae bacterium]|nr:M23 family metallopeptidase [Leptospiraceae bacterium]
MAKKNKKGQRSTATGSLSAREYADHLLEDHEQRQQKRQSRWQSFQLWLQDWLEYIHERGRERLTVMVIPHTEKKILTLHVSLYTIAATILIVLIVLFASVFNLIGKSGKEIQFYDMGLSNSQFNLQSMQMAEEMIPLHELILNYSSTIADMYLKLDGQADIVEGQGGAAQAVTLAEVEKLKAMLQECRSAGEACSQQLTEDILQKVILLSEQDNLNLRRSIELSEKILAELKTPAKKNLLQNTPSIWPTNGYLKLPYGLHVDPFEGREKFVRGITIGTLPGTEVYATAPGVVSNIAFDTERGLQVSVKHRYGILTYYANLDRVRVKEGDKVDKGQVIAYSGNSGLCDGYQLYYEVHVGTVAYNPHAFLNHLRDQWLIQPKI